MLPSIQRIKNQVGRALRRAPFFPNRKSSIVNHQSSILLALSLLHANAATFTEPFSAPPTAWQTQGPFTSAFHWNSETQNLQVTWDSRQPNTFFTHALPFALRRTDNFSAELTLTLHSLQLGIDPAKTYTFQLAFGFLNLAEATRANYYRGSGVNTQTGPRSLVEFAYFPDAGLDATIGPIIASSNNRIAFAHTHPLELVPNETYRIRIAFDSATQQLQTTILHDNQPLGPIRAVTFPISYGDFRLDTFSIHTYSHEGQAPPEYAGSLLATGAIDDIVVTYPDPPRIEMTGQKTETTFIATFPSLLGWRYDLQRTEDFATWTPITTADGTNATLELTDPTPPTTQAHYRIQATRPIETRIIE